MSRAAERRRCGRDGQYALQGAGAPYLGEYLGEYLGGYLGEYLGCISPDVQAYLPRQPAARDYLGWNDGGAVIADFNRMVRDDPRVEQVMRSGRDTAKMRRRCTRDAAEMQPRYTRDTPEIHPRCAAPCRSCCPCATALLSFDARAQRRHRRRQRAQCRHRRRQRAQCRHRRRQRRYRPPSRRRTREPRWRPMLFRRAALAAWAA